MRARAPVVFLWLLAAWGALVLIGWAAGAAITPATAHADLSLVKDLARARTGALTWLAHALSFIGSGWVLIPVGIVLTVALIARRRPRDGIAIALSLGAGIGLSSLVKPLVGRARPPLHHLEHVTSASFPSGHATQSTAFFVAVALAWLGRHPAAGRRAVIAIAAGLIAGVALSRVYLAVHYPTDVVAGILLGGAWALVTRRLVCGPTWPGRSPRAAPRRTARSPGP